MIFSKYGSSIETWQQQDGTVFFGRIKLVEDEHFGEIYSDVKKHYLGKSLIGPVDVTYGVKSGISTKHHELNYIGKPFMNKYVYDFLKELPVDRKWVTYISKKKLSDIEIPSFEPFQFKCIKGETEIREIVQNGEQLWGTHDSSVVYNEIRNTVLSFIDSDLSFIVYDRSGEMCGYSLVLVDHENELVIHKQMALQRGSRIKALSMCIQTLQQSKRKFPMYRYILSTMKFEGYLKFLYFYSCIDVDELDEYTTFIDNKSRI